MKQIEFVDEITSWKNMNNFPQQKPHKQQY